MVAPTKNPASALLTAIFVFSGLSGLSGPAGAQTAAAQVAACQVQGRVVDPSGHPLPGVAVVVSGRAPVVTDRDGRYCVRDVPAGARSILLALDAFVPVTLTIDPAAPRPVVHDATLKPSFAERLVVTGTRTTRLANSVPVRTEVVDRQAIALSAARSLADAVEYTTGVRVENNCQNCNFSQIRLLGLEGPYTQILVDGQPIISSLAQVYGIEQIPARMIDRIEVVKGGGSALYGAGAVGGIVNLISPEPSQTGGGFEWRTGRGDGFGGSLNWAASDLATIFTAFVQRDVVDARDVNADGFSDVSRRRLTAAGGRAVRSALGGSGKLTLDLSHIREARRGGDDLDRPPHEALIAEDIASRRSSLSGSWYQHVNGGWDYRVTVAGAVADRDSYYGTGRDPNAYGDTSNWLALVDGQVNRYVGAHTISWGAQGTREHTIDRQPAYGRHLDATFTGGGVFAQDDWTIRPGVQLVSGLRADWHSALARAILSPRFALMLSPSTDLDIRVSVARGFRAPQVFDEDLHLSSVAGEVRIIQLDPALREERATSATAGAEWKPQAGPGQALFEANVFHTRLTDLFHVIDRDDPLTDAFEALKVNFGGARVYGAELNAGWGIGDDLVIQGGVVVQRARFDTAEPDFGSRDFFRSPRRYGNVSIRWQSHDGWQLFAGGRFTGSMHAPHYAGAIDANRLEKTPAFAAYDVTAGRRISMGDRALVLTLAARNLTNAYQRDLDAGPLRDANYVYGPRFPRTISLVARWDF
jgi:outer membrane receptor for ferrienterochelin and colicins